MVSSSLHGIVIAEAYGVPAVLVASSTEPVFKYEDYYAGTGRELPAPAATWRDGRDAARQRGKLTVIPMQGWRRSMRWPETGLRFVPTSPYIQDFAACVGYAMTGLGCQIGGFSHGIGTQYPFRGVSTKLRSMEQVQKDLTALRLPGLAFKRVALTSPTGAPLGYGASFVAGRPSRIAILPIGYGDGWRRGLSGKARVILRGRFVPMVGTIGMDLTFADVTDVPGAQPGDEIILIGANGKLAIPPTEPARSLGTVASEILSGLGKRVPRIYR